MGLYFQIKVSAKETWVWNPQRVMKMFSLIPGQAVVFKPVIKPGLVIYEIFIEAGSEEGPVLSLGPFSMLQRRLWSQTDLSLHSSLAGVELDYFRYASLSKCLYFYNGDNNTPCRLQIIAMNHADPLLRMLEAFRKWEMSAQPYELHSCSSKYKEKHITVLSETIQHIRFSPTDTMTRNIKYSWSWLNTRRNMQQSWKESEESSQGPLPEGSASLHQDLCLLILYSRSFRYHFIVSVSSFNKDSRDMCNQN